MDVTKSNPQSSLFQPLEKVTVSTDSRKARRLLAVDGAGQCYADIPISAGRPVSFKMRGKAGQHTIVARSADGTVVDGAAVRLVARTGLSCDKGPYAGLFERLQQLIARNAEGEPWVINGRRYNIIICWSRDHVYTLKAAKYFMEDVTSGLDYYMESQTSNGMFWDCIYHNTEVPAPTWLGEALGKGWYRYDDHMKYIVRRVPVLADTEYVFTEGVWYAWKASSDDAWMARQLPRLEKALTYMTTDPLRWSKKHGLVHRSFTADEWDFANPHYCAGDHRCIHKGDPTFFFHGNNSGMYAMYWRMAQMYEHLGNVERARELRVAGEALRTRANAKLFFKTHYGHMIPESMDPKKVYALVGDERERMSLSTGYTINRGLPTHAMAVKTIKEYQRRGKEKKAGSFAEWWTMDPPYAPEQWPGQHTNTAGCPVGEYMNGGICSIIAGEVSKAAFDHGCEAYGVDILDRVWELMERDNGELHQVYKRLPAKAELPRAVFQPIDISEQVNRGLRHRAHKGVAAWTSEGTNDMRNLPVGTRTFGAIEFHVIDPARNEGRSVLRLGAAADGAPAGVTIPVSNLECRSLYFMHCLAHSTSRGSVVGMYDVCYTDGTEERIWVRDGQEIGSWWGIGEGGVNHAIARRAWWGPNPSWKTVGLYMYGWNNPHPDKKVCAVRLQTVAAPGRGAGIMLAAVSASNQPVAFEQNIRSYGLPDCWAQAAVYYAIAEGLAGIEDKGTAFSTVSVSPRWAQSKAGKARVTLHYPSSDGYCTYEYHLDRGRRRIELELTGSFSTAKVHCLLPGGAAKKVTVDGKTVAFRNVKVEKSRYVDFVVQGMPRGVVRVGY
jgi:hypothetical protein